MLRRPKESKGQRLWNDVDTNSYKQARRGVSAWNVRIALFALISVLSITFLLMTAHNAIQINFLELENESTNATTSLRRPAWARDPERAPIATILQHAGYDLHDTSLFDEETIESLPSWSHINQQFGAQPKIYGLETCPTFQHGTASKAHERRIAVAGTFNSGTNLLAELLEMNCHNQDRVDKRGTHSTGMEWQGENHCVQSESTGPSNLDRYLTSLSMMMSHSALGEACASVVSRKSNRNVQEPRVASIHEYFNGTTGCRGQRPLSLDGFDVPARLCCSV